MVRASNCILIAYGTLKWHWIEPRRTRISFFYNKKYNFFLIILRNTNTLKMLHYSAHSIHFLYQLATLSMWLLDGQTHSSVWTDQDWSKPLWIFNRCNFSKVKYGSALRDDIRVIWNFWNSNLVVYLLATNWNLVTVRFSLTTTKVKMRANLGWSLVVSVKILRKKNLEALFSFSQKLFCNSKFLTTVNFSYS